MNRRQFLKCVPLGVGLGLALGLCVPTGAQGRGGQGGAGGPMMGRGRSGRQNDPSRSSIQELLQREDVRAHLFLNGRQKEQLDSQSQQAQADLQAQMQASRASRGTLRGLAPEERQAKMQELQDQRQSAMQAFATGQETKIAAVLTPQQMKRLAELDLQWRGPLALSDPKVADKVSLEPEQAVKVKEELTAFRTLQQETMRAQFASFGGRGGRGANAPAGAGNAQPGQAGTAQPPLDPQAMQARLAEAQKTVDKARKAAGDKVLALLTPSQRQAWKTLQGQPFTFRTVI